MSKGRLVIAALLILVALLTYYGQQSPNPITNEVQHVSLTPEQEIALGLEAAPEMARQFDGIANDPAGRARIERVGQRLVSRTAVRNSPYRFDFHLLDDDRTLNAFALPGGQVFITEALLRRLRTDGELAGVLGHEIGHVVARHGAEHLAKAQLTQALGGAATIATYDPDNPYRTRQTAAVAQAVGALVQMRFGRNDELESDRLGVRFMSEAGYDPRAMVQVMKVLAAASKGGRPPEFFSTHPNPERRIERIQQAIRERFANGVPDNLEP